jgi:hypothetical protein
MNTVATRRPQCQVPVLRRIGCHRVAGIENQVEEHLLELDVVAGNARTKRQYKTGKLDGRKATMSELWNAALAA